VRPLIVITGQSGSGKSQLGARIADRLGYKSINIGDALLKELARQGIPVKSRKEIGRLFMEVSGIEGYLDLVKRLAEYDTILDGVRIARALPVLRQIHPELIHIHKLAIPHATDDRQDEYDAEMAVLSDIADFKIEWMSNESGISCRIEQELVAFIDVKQ